MKWLGIPLLRGAMAACLVAIAATGFYYAGAPYPAPQIRRLHKTVSGGQRGRGNLRVQCASNSQDMEGTFGCLLPQDWQADCRSGELWIVHYNPDGTVADSLLFDNLGSFYDWAETHPDFCDLDVDKVAFGALRAERMKVDSD